MRSWSELIVMKAKSREYDWCLGGYFRSIMNVKERKCISRNSSIGEISEFNDFIDMLYLVDLPLVGKRFTWGDLEGSYINTIDRFFLSKNMVNL